MLSVTICPNVTSSDALEKMYIFSIIDNNVLSSCPTLKSTTSLSGSEIKISLMISLKLSSVTKRSTNSGAASSSAALTSALSVNILPMITLTFDRLFSTVLSKNSR